MAHHISLHMTNVLQKSDVHGMKHNWYVDDGFGNLTPVSNSAFQAANYSMSEVIHHNWNWG